MNLGREDEFVEFKKSTGDHKEALQTISAMLNKHGRGEVYFGVNDDGEVVGQEVTDSTIRQIASWISDKIEPPIVPTIRRLMSDDDRPYLRVAFSGTETPYSADGRYYMRVGTSNNVLSALELKALITGGAFRTHPWDALPSGRSIADIDEKALKDFVARGNRCERIPDEYTNAEEVLSKLGLIASDGTLTNAAATLFCRSEHGLPRMIMGVLAGNNKVDILDLRQEDGPLLELLKKAESYVISNIRRRLIIGETGMFRQEIPEIPADAVREAVANALCHRNYMVEVPVQVNVYRDTVEICNPGLFPNGDSPEKHLDGETGNYVIQNPNLALALFRAGVIEKYGSGIPRIKQSCHDSGVTFRYKQGTNYTSVVFERPGSQLTIEQAAGSSGEGNTIREGDMTSSPDDLASLTDRERLVIKYAFRHGKVTTAELADELKISRRTASVLLKKLAQIGKLQWFGKSGRDPHQYYRLSDNGR